jgi:hypothetical protein
MCSSSALAQARKLYATGMATSPDAIPVWTCAAQFEVAQVSLSVTLSRYHVTPSYDPFCFPYASGSGVAEAVACTPQPRVSSGSACPACWMTPGGCALVAHAARCNALSPSWLPGQHRQVACALRQGASQDPQEPASVAVYDPERTGGGQPQDRAAAARAGDAGVFQVRHAWVALFTFWPSLSRAVLPRGPRHA